MYLFEIKTENETVVFTRSLISGRVEPSDKVTLIRIFQSAFMCGLGEAKDISDTYIQI